MKLPMTLTGLAVFASYALLPAASAAADQEALFYDAENLIRYTDDVKGLTALIARGLDVKRPSANSQGRTLLFTAATEAKLAMIDALIKAGASPNAQDESGMTALRHVAWTGKDPVSVAKRLIAVKADVNLQADDHWTPLIQAMYADAEIVVPLAQVLLQGGADPAVVNDEGHSALMLAAERGHAALIPALVKAGAAVDERDDDDATVLGLAAEGGRTAVVQALLEAGADPNLGDEKNQTPLMKAASRDQLDAVKLLLEHCAHTDPVDTFFKWNALKFAKSDPVRSAIQGGAAANCPK